MKKIGMLNRIVLILTFLSICGGKSAAWFSDPKLNTPVAPKGVNQITPAEVPDGQGGVIITWSEYVVDPNSQWDIYAQRIDSHGQAVWTAPVAICTTAGAQDKPQIVSDQQGGAVIAWQDARSGTSGTLSDMDIYGQRITGAGQIMWNVNGVAISTAAEWQLNMVMAPDGLGGAIIAWDDGRSGNSQIYAQRVNQNGQAMWQMDGILAVTVTDGRSEVDIVSDGFGGALLVWTDYRPVNITNIYAQKLNANGDRIWSDQGKGICTVVGNQFGPHVASDGFGGAIICWADGRLGDEFLDIYAQRIDAGGTTMWQSNGVPVTSAPGSQVENAIISDGLGGAIIVWGDGRKEIEDTDIYVQRVNAEGDMLWTADGVAVVATDEYQAEAALISDGSGGTFVAWQDFYRGGSSWNIFAQHIDSNGQAQWDDDGIAVSTADEGQNSPVIVSDGGGGSIILWQDGRSGTYNDIYAQQIDSRGLLGGGEFRFYTSDIDGTPKSTFGPGELIFFKATWTMPTPAIPDLYEGVSQMVIDSGTDFRQESIEYQIITEATAAGEQR